MHALQLAEPSQPGMFEQSSGGGGDGGGDGASCTHPGKQVGGFELQYLDMHSLQSATPHPATPEQSASASEFKRKPPPPTEALGAGRPIISASWQPGRHFEGLEDQ